MIIQQISLSNQEKKWLHEQRVTRLTDNKEVQIYPMGAERHLSSVLSGHKKSQYHIREDVENKHVLVIPGHGNSSFLLAEAGAKLVTVYDKDPVTITWMKAFKKYYHYREFSAGGKPYPSIGELLSALTRWYPPFLRLPVRQSLNLAAWIINPKLLRRSYLFYMLDLVRQALKANTQDNFELNKNIQFQVGEISQLVNTSPQPLFDTAFIPYLLGVKNGIEKKEEIIAFMKQIITLVPQGSILISPSRDIKEFYFFGSRYFITSGYETIHAIPELYPYAVAEDDWFRSQGLTVFRASANEPLRKDSE
ncbi:ABC transporter permease [Legionella clemsonensis]|uniref:Uncharacterized protein n=1 Tax=Legionella clemsonensis TaxID=1867846 RepID=A0A222P5L1_9GAMM|nr:ABC transporter permease [Legionella clemsonensis]ASQ47144.1 hypothetical protein clem_13055 [Legionella clemsonensis]